MDKYYVADWITPEYMDEGTEQAIKELSERAFKRRAEREGVTFGPMQRDIEEEARMQNRSPRMSGLVARVYVAEVIGAA